MQQIAL